MGRAEELFQRIKDDRIAEIQRMIAEAVTEELFLDYKQAATKSFSTLDPSDRRNLAKAVSGFGNSDGGIIVWGVGCHASSSGDIPFDAPVGDPIAFKSLLDGIVGGVTLPAHSGVENLPLQLPGGTGYVVTHIPQGLNVPYRVLVKNEKEEYYIRAGSSFLPTPHAVLAGLFGRAPHSVLEIRLKFRDAQFGVQGKPAVLRFRVTLTNRGRGLAKGVFLSIDVDDRADCIIRRAIDHRRWSDWTTKNHHRARYTAVATEEFPAIPPGSEVEVVSLNVELYGATISGGITINIVVGSETGPGSSYDVTFPADTVADIVEILTHSPLYATAPERENALDVVRSRIEACLQAHS
jgi:hypothetical protein